MSKEDSKDLLDWIESSGEAWITIDRRYDMHGKIYFGVKVCSRQHHSATVGKTVREALQKTINLFESKKTS